MNSTRTLFAVYSLGLIANISLFGQGFVASSLEQYNYQVGDNQITLKSYDGFDDVDGFDNITGLSLSINGGTAENIPYDSFYEAFKRGRNYDTLAEMLAERPINGTYTHNLTGTPSGSVTITAPNVPYADGIPVNPVFTITGVSGKWGRDPNGVGRFFFDPATVTSFTVSMNAYNASTQGGHYVYAVYVADITSGFNYLAEYSSDLVVDGETPPVPANLTLTFTKGLPLDGGDSDPSTFGFTDGTRFEIEGEHVNIFGLQDAGLGEGSMKAFPYQTVTAFNIEADANPTASMPTATSIAIIDQAIGKPDNVTNTFFMDWETTSVDAPVDVYRSVDLTNWGSPVSELNQSGAYSEPITLDSRAFFVVVPAGTRYPPVP
jgi:hypothetical protein